MLTKTLLGAAVGLALASSALACSCAGPPELSECAVNDDQAAILVKVLDFRTFSCEGGVDSPVITDFGIINDGSSVAKVKILKVFDDNTDLELSVGDFTSVSTSPNGALCGYSMEPGSKQLLFVSTAGASFGGSDGTCEPPAAPLSTFLCSGNIQSPTKAQKQELRKGCRVSCKA